MIRLASIFILLAFSIVGARPPLSQTEIIDQALEKHKDDKSSVFEMIIPFTAKEFYPVLFRMQKSSGATKISDSKYDIRGYMESLGVPFVRDAVAIADKKKHILIFRDTGERLYLISVFWRPAFPSVYRKAEQTRPANPRPFGTSGMAPADSASRAGAMPEASGDS